MSACLSEASYFLTSASTLLPADLLLEAGALRFGLAGRFLELALTHIDPMLDRHGDAVPGTVPVDHIQPTLQSLILTRYSP